MVVPAAKALSWSKAPDIPGLPDNLEPFANGDLSVWVDGIPERWGWYISYDKFCQVDSVKFQPLPGSGVVIEGCNGDHSHGPLVQRFAVEGDKYYRIRARYEASETPADGYFSAWMMSFGDQYSFSQDYCRHQTTVLSRLESCEETWAEIILRTDPMATVGVVSFESRHSGAKLILHEVTVDTLSLSDDEVIQLLLTELKHNYVPQSDCLVDWDDLEQRFTGDEQKNKEQDYRRLGADLLMALDEPRISFERGNIGLGKQLMRGTKSRPVLKEDKLTLKRTLAISNQLVDGYGRHLDLDIGWTSDRVAYFDLGWMFWIGSKGLKELVDADGVLIDLRAHNSRIDIGRYKRALELAGHFVTESRVYGYSKLNNHGTVVEDTLRIEPIPGYDFAMPMVFLIGSGCSGLKTEFLMMVRDEPNITLVGRPTRGGIVRFLWGMSRDIGLGLKQFILPTGSRVKYPNRSLWSPDGELINDSHGFQPDVYVEPDGSLDPVFDEGLRVLREKIAEGKQK
ncbi:MAG: hypothetical protein GY752_00860 [bacterium]|nr:hypothetical protein [bacterium]MCP4798451.1 hypothetical protein [bacterium]